MLKTDKHILHLSLIARVMLGKIIFTCWQKFENRQTDTVRVQSAKYISKAGRGTNYTCAKNAKGTFQKKKKFAVIG